MMGVLRQNLFLLTFTPVIWGPLGKMGMGGF